MIVLVEYQFEFIGLKMTKKLIAIIILILNVSFAQLTINSNRLIFNNNKKSSQSMLVTNISATPYLIQTWIEDIDGNKIMRPLAALPVLQRLNAEQSKYIKVSFIGDPFEFSENRETLLFLNILGVPPKMNSTDQISMTLQLTLKLLYRPKGLPQYDEMGWIKELILEKNKNELSLSNPTPYHIIIYGFSHNLEADIIEKDLVLKPFSSEKVDINLRGNTLYIYIVNDFGSGEAIGYDCRVNNCKMILEK